MTDEDFPYVTEVYRDLQEHGEVHAVVEGHDGEMELRQGATVFHWDRNCLSVVGPDTTHIVRFDSLYSHYCPREIFHG